MAGGNFMSHTIAYELQQQYSKSACQKLTRGSSKKQAGVAPFRSDGSELPLQLYPELSILKYTTQSNIYSFPRTGCWNAQRRTTSYNECRKHRVRCNNISGSNQQMKDDTIVSNKQQLQ